MANKTNGKKNTKKTASAGKAKGVAKATETTQKQAQVVSVLTLDVKQNHSMRKALNSQGVDAFALHGFDKLSKGYVAACLALAAKRGETFKACNALRLLVCNGVANWIRLDETSGNYVRNGALAVRDCTAEQAVFGNVNALSELYGKAVQVLTEDEANAAYDAQKEETVRSIGTGKARFTQRGRVILSGIKNGTAYDVLAWKAGGKLVFANCEGERNAHNATHVYTVEKTTEAKAK